MHCSRTQELDHAGTADKRLASRALPAPPPRLRSLSERSGPTRRCGRRDVPTEDKML
jgi:hypothetical protein